MGLHHIDHYNIDVVDLEKSKEFYCGILGLVDGARPPLPFPGAWLYGENETPIVHLSDVLSNDQRVAAPTARLNHISFECSGAEDIRIRLERAEVEFKVIVLPVIDKTQFFMRDPNGIFVELIFPAAETRASDREAMAARRAQRSATG